MMLGIAVQSFLGKSELLNLLFQGYKNMKLREWQSQCIVNALDHFSAGNPHFMCLATPGAGKTLMASQLTRQLFEQDAIDLVICLSPSAIVSKDFQEALEQRCGKRIDGAMGSYGCSLTYQAMLSLEENFWTLLNEYRVFVVFDEIHHCAGNELSRSNAWGEKIISEIQGKAEYTLALTGTPLRSDSIPISLSTYCDDDRVQCNYSYGLSRAIADNVCRIPQLIMIDNDNIAFRHGDQSKEYSSIKDLFSQENCSYQDIVENDNLMEYMIRQADKKLNQIRKKVPNAGGLIVASSVRHAEKLHAALEAILNETADIATYQEDHPISTIQKYKHGNTKWIVSVGMISEGTNIPRLQVCCHLTRVKTELYFRQILGRILRSSGRHLDRGYMYLPAEPSLVKFANRIADDVPKEQVVKFDSAPSEETNQPINVPDPDTTEKHLPELILNMPDSYELDIQKHLPYESALSRSYGATLDLFGKFNHEVLLLNKID